MSYEQTPGAKMVYLIKRRPEVSRDELVAHWFANHMPDVAAGQAKAAADGKPSASRYWATLFQPGKNDTQAWDGMAQLWWESATPRPDVAHGTDPRDSFQERAQPYSPWPTDEYVIINGSQQLAIAPNEVGSAFPSSRSGFCKVTFLVAVQDGADHQALFAHWLSTHAENVSNVLRSTGGVHYVVSHSQEPAVDPYAGMAEIWFESLEGWREYQRVIEADGMEQWVGEGTVVLRADTELIGIP